MKLIVIVISAKYLLQVVIQSHAAEGSALRTKIDCLKKRHVLLRMAFLIMRRIAACLKQELEKASVECPLQQTV